MKKIYKTPIVEVTYMIEDVMLDVTYSTVDDNDNTNKDFGGLGWTPGNDIWW
jgi:hypothetical protein